ncbi:MAG TPA: cytochrome d ubiquinol oxidase subunit II [Xanthobacteraceae bacterium]|nr:cytochrome d ubiquinol oxidase subunit II [Xanthobacteraceae bacterium]
MEWYLPLIWAAVIGVAVAMYVVLDGFDLGIGILFPFARDERQREQMMASVKPFWDGNETWLVLGGGGLFVAFPLAYSILMPAFYIPVLIMLLALVFRGVAFEFRAVAASTVKWSTAFAGGSLIAALCQGAILGSLIEGVKVENGSFAGGPFDWATPFAGVCALGVVAGYGLLGATWLVMKTAGEVAERARAQARLLLAAVLFFMAVVSLWTPLELPRIAGRWFSIPNIFYLWPVPVITAFVAYAAWWGLERRRDMLPFFSAIGLFLLGYLGLVISDFPYLVPPTLTVWDTAAAPVSQIFMLVGTLVLLPIILAYTALVYWVFRGKVQEGERYH